MIFRYTLFHHFDFMSIIQAAVFFPSVLPVRVGVSVYIPLPSNDVRGATSDLPSVVRGGADAVLAHDHVRWLPHQHRQHHSW